MVASAKPKNWWGDIELAARALAVPIVAVTGTNGKSTTTHLVAAGLRGAGLRAAAAGNVGEPALGLVGQALDVAVLEVSSFQLESTESLRPRVAVLLNLTPDHLDRHGNFEAYRAAKARILAHQQPDDTAVLSADDPEVWSLAAEARARVLPFSTRAPLEHGAWLDAGAALLREPEGQALRVAFAELRLVGAHNRENVLAALAAAWAAGADPARAMAAMARFPGLPHRMEEVGSRDGVRFVNDSKATNPGAALGIPEGMCIGDPKVITHAIKQWESIGVDQVNFMLNAAEILPQEQVLESLHMFAREVLPAFPKEEG